PVGTPQQSTHNLVAVVSQPDGQLLVSLIACFGAVVGVDCLAQKTHISLYGFLGDLQLILVCTRGEGGPGFLCQLRTAAIRPPLGPGSYQDLYRQGVLAATPIAHQGHDSLHGIIQSCTKSPLSPAHPASRPACC